VSAWSEIFLGVIAVATLAMAIVLVGVVVAASRLARRVGRLLDQLDTEVKPLFDHLNAIGRDASRATELATAQVERIDRLFADLAQRLDQTLQGFQGILHVPAREGRAALAALAAAFRAMRARPRQRSEEEDALFI
jgi:uncharacterized protein YoxC